MTTKTVQQLEEEAAAAATALREAKEAEARAAREALAAARRAEEEKQAEMARTKMDKAFDPIVDATRDLAKKSVKRFSVEFVGDVTMSIQAEERSVSSWRSAPTGRYLIVVEYAYEWGRDKRAKRFPPLKAGGHNIEKIIAYINELIEIKKAKAIDQAKKDEQKKNAQALAISLREELGVTESKLAATRSHYTYGGRYEEQTAPEGHVYVNIGSFCVNAEQARLLIKTFEGIKDQLNALKGEAK